MGTARAAQEEVSPKGGPRVRGDAAVPAPLGGAGTAADAAAAVRRALGGAALFLV